MKIREIISEGLNHPCIVVDVQPAYAAYAPKICHNVIQYVNKQTGPVLMFVNAEQDGLTDDTIQDIQEWWAEATDYTINWDRFQIVDKGFGHFRAWMDNGVSDALIIKVIRMMYQQRVNSIDDLFGGEGSEQYEESMQHLAGDEYEDWMTYELFNINWTSVSQLKRFNGAYIMGGGRNECLREVELLMNAFNIKYKRIDSLVY
jgi:hypothetical protein